jgi:hypothetical protein
MAKDESTGQQLVSLHVWHANLVRSLTQRLPRRVRCVCVRFCGAMCAIRRHVGHESPQGEARMQLINSSARNIVE